MNKNTKILFVDMDGTLLNDQKEITAGNRRAIEAALAAGHKIVISTGRATASAIRLAQRLSLTSDGCYAITYNGGCIYDLYHKKSIYRKTISKDNLRLILDAARQFGIYAHTYSENEILTEHDTPTLHRYAHNTQMSYLAVNDVCDLLPDGSEKIIVIDYHDHQHLVDFQKSVSDLIIGKADTFFSCDEYLEVVPCGVSKGSAIRLFCEYLEIPVENTVSAGDAQNDIAMLETTHIGAVMKNAADFMFAHGNYITEHDNNHDGIAEVIDKFIL
ncbi:MAG: Cof-type HAD-IIB family hydrolase [Eubacteriales bacterium]|nr:Cof-type HAD-IIB family hydrolase [Eubacteriales bacterium]